MISNTTEVAVACAHPRHVLVAVGVYGASWLAPGTLSRFGDYWSELLFLPADLRPRVPEWDFFTRWSVSLFQSAWLYAGWLRFPAPLGWYWVILLLSIVGVLGPRSAICPVGRTQRAGGVGVVA